MSGFILVPLLLIRVILPIGLLLLLGTLKKRDQFEWE